MIFRRVPGHVDPVRRPCLVVDVADDEPRRELPEADVEAPARVGPVGLREICTYKWVVFGDGHTRPA